MKWLFKVNLVVEAILEPGVYDYQPRGVATITFYFPKARGKYYNVNQHFWDLLTFFVFFRESSNFPCNQCHFPKASSQTTLYQLAIWVRLWSVNLCELEINLVQKTFTVYQRNAGHHGTSGDIKKNKIKRARFELREPWVSILVQPRSSCVALEKQVNLSEPHSTCLLVRTKWNMTLSRMPNALHRW